MKISKEILKSEGVKTRLRLGTKTERGVISNGQHKVKLVADEIIEKLDYSGKKQRYVRYTVKEGEELKYYDVAMYNSSGDVHYLVQRLAELSEGSWIVMELKNRGTKNYVAITPLAGEIIESEYEEDDEEDEEGKKNAARAFIKNLKLDGRLIKKEEIEVLKDRCKEQGIDLIEKSLEADAKGITGLIEFMELLFDEN